MTELLFKYTYQTEKQASTTLPVIIVNSVVLKLKFPLKETLKIKTCIS